MSLKHKPVTQSILRLNFLTHVATYAPLTYSAQESENNLHFMILTYV